MASVATVPLTYALGARTVGRGAGIAAALASALSPFAIFYASRARTYALATALVTAALLAMAAGVDTGRRAAWVVCWGCAAGALLTHYTTGLVLLGALTWVVVAHRERLRPALTALVAAGLLLVPWALYARGSS